MNFLSVSVGDQTPPGDKYAGFNMVDSVGPLHMFLDMDAPHTHAWNALGSAVADSLEYFPLGGDSGGGIFAEFEGRWELIGVNGTVTMNLSALMDHGWYGQVGRLNRVAPQVAWIREVSGRAAGTRD